MSQETANIGTEFADGIKRNAGLAIVVGVILLIGGVLAIGSPFVAGLSATLAVGVLLIIGGVSELFFAFRAGSLGKGLLTFILGILSVVVGAVMLSQPGVGLASLTLFLAAYFFVSGVFEIVWGLRMRPAGGWGWAVFAGIVSVLLGLMIWGQYPFSGVWAVGTLVGIKLIFSGWTLIVLGMAARRAAKDASQQEQTA